MANMTPEPIDRTRFPSWFKAAEAGFKFHDYDGDKYIVVGEGGWREAVHAAEPRLARVALYDIAMRPWGLIVAWSYKGEWHLRDVSREDADWWRRCLPGWGEGDPDADQYHDGAACTVCDPALSGEE